MPQDFAALQWVAHDIERIADELSKSLLGYADNVSDETRLRQALTQAHQLHATLRALGAASVARLGAEIEATIQSILHGRIATSEAALQALLAATLQLPGYLRRIAAERRESPFDVQGIVNELLELRGESPLPTPAPEQLIDVSELDGGLDDGSAPASSEDLQLLRRARTQFQVELLGLLKNDDAASRLQRLQKLFTLLGQRLRQSGHRLFWQAAAAMCQALDRGGVSFDESARSLLRDLDGAFRVALSMEKSLYTRSPDTQLYRRLLRLVGSSEPVSPQLVEIQRRHRLTPGATSARSTAALDDFGATATVVDVLGGELARVLERLETGAEDAAAVAGVLHDVEPELTRFTKILNGLGYRAERDLLLPQLEQIRRGVGGETATDEALMAISAALLEVDQRLAMRVRANGADSARVESRRSPLLQARSALCREVQAGLELIKQSVNAYVQSRDEVRLLEGNAARLHAIGGALRIAELGEAADALERCRAYLNAVVNGDRPPPSPTEIEHLADALSSVEYFVERFAVDQTPARLLLAAAEAALTSLESPTGAAAAETAAPETAAWETAVPETEAVAFAALQSPVVAEMHEAEAEPLPSPNVEPTPQVVAAAADTQGNQAPERDPEFVAIFVEEAAEVLGAIAEQLPSWHAAPESGAPLAELRRSFHTLKGSGRMVGAQIIADLAWAIERLLNRVIEKTVAVSAGVVTVVDRASLLMPDLVSAFSRDAAPDRTVVSELQAMANALADNEALAPRPAPAAEEPVPLAGDAIALEPEESLDAEIREIFVAEAAEVLEAITEHFHAWRNTPQSEAPLTELRRAFHTLKGSGRMVGAELVADLAWSIEQLLNRVIEQLVPVSDDVIMVVARAHALVPELVSAFAESRAVDRAPVDELRAFAEAIARNEPLPQALPHAALDAEMHADVVVESKQEPSEAFVPALLEDWVPELEPEEQALTELPDDTLLHHLLEAQIAPTSEPLPIVETDAAASDAQLLAVFAEETAQHLAVLREFLADASGTVSEHVQRTMHTLKGSTQAAGTAELAAIVVPLEGITQAAAHSGRLFGTTERELMREFCDLADALLAANMTISAEQVLQAQRLADRCEALLRESVAAEAAAQAVDARLARFLEEALEKLFHATILLQSWREESSAAESRSALAGELQAIHQKAEQLAVMPVQALAEPLHRVVGSAALGSAPVPAELFDAAKEAIEVLLDVLDRLAAGQIPEMPVAAAQRLNAIGLLAEPEAPAAHDRLDGELPPGLNQAAARTRIARDLTQADSGVIGIFLSEADELMAGIDEAMDAWRLAREARAPFEDLQRLLHTLKGGARMAGLRYLADISHNFETFLINEDLRFGSFDAGFFQRVGGFHEQLAQSMDLVRELAPTLETDAAAEPPPMPLQVVLPDLPIAEVSAAMRAQMVADLAQTDTELLGVFLQEADELMAAIDAAIVRWRSDRESSAPSDDLQRLLHTLKGGARMAGLTVLGDISHDFETFLADHGGALAPDNDFFARIIAHHEQLMLIMDIARDAPKASAPAPAEAAASVVAIETPADAIAEAPPQTPAVAVPLPMPMAPPRSPPVPAKTREREEVVRVSAQLLEELVNLAGETSIARGRVEEQVNELGQLFDDMQGAIERVQGQVRRLDIATEAQVLFRRERAESSSSDGFDPLEMDRYSQLQQLSRSLVETASDLLDIKRTLAEKTRDLETVLVQQSRINSQLQEGLMRSRMVPFSSILPRLRRIVRQISGELGKQVELELGNIAGDLDRGILERVVAPLEHMLRNAVDHGIESVERRRAVGKPDSGNILIEIARDGGDVVISVADDGGGINLEAVREKAIERGLMQRGSLLSDHEVSQFILHAGFSTAEKVTQISGRGVGMDVVNSEIRQMGGLLEIHSKPGSGTRFVVRLPFTVSVSRALLVRVGTEMLALPLNTVEGVVRLRTDELRQYEGPDAKLLEYAGQSYRMLYLGALLYPGDKIDITKVAETVPVVLVRGGGQAVAVEVDRLLGASEIVVKSLGPQFGAVPGLSGATVLGDGSVVVILDVPAVLRAEAAIMAGGRATLAQETAVDRAARPPLIMVVDDSVTVRKVTTRFLEREGMQVATAKDGLDAMARLQEQMPDLMLLDIEMPHMDGFEVLSKVRISEQLRHLPIIMITSRTGEKHRERALALGASLYLGKPYQESVLLDHISRLLKRKQEATA
jgi:chemosensory pili system protein ChpA (sensor histidine kinase/response regulator)